MGLLDMFNTDEGRFGLSLLAAAAPTAQPMGFGQRLAGAMQLQDQWKQSQADRQLQQQEAEWLRTQRDRKAKTWAMEDQAAQAQAAKRAAIPSLFSQDGSGGLSGFNVARALELGLGPEEIDKWSKIPNAGRAKVARTIEGRDEQGRPVTYQVDEFGQRVGDALEQWKAPVIVNQGDRQTFVDPVSGLPKVSLGVYMSQAERDASARGWAANSVAQQRLQMDRQAQSAGGYKYDPELRGYVPTAPGSQFIPLQGLPGGTPPVKLTEGEAKNTLFLGQMRDASRILSRADSNPVAVAMTNNPATNIFAPKDAQVAAQAQRQWAEAYLRAKTGAAATESEVSNNIKTFFPTVGDSAEVIRRKAEARMAAERDMQAPAGRGAALAGTGALGDGKNSSQKQVVKTGMYGGKKVVQYSDGSVDYAD